MGIGLFTTFVSANAQAEKVHVAVASNFIAPMKKLVMAYKTQSDVQIKVSYGSSGKVYAQIVRGAPFEVFLSADQQKPEELEKRQLIVPGSRFTYATGSLVFWSRDPDLLTHNFELQRLATESLLINRLAIANPRTAPYGKAASEVMQNLDLTSQLKPKLVTGENIAQTFMFVNSKNAQVGFIAYSQYLQLEQDKKGSAILVPVDLHKPIRQDAVLLKEASDAAKSFFAFLRSKPAQTIISQSGYYLKE